MSGYDQYLEMRDEDYTDLAVRDRAQDVDQPTLMAMQALRRSIDDLLGLVTSRYHRHGGRLVTTLIRETCADIADEANEAFRLSAPRQGVDDKPLPY